MKLKAIILDLNGTIVDDEDIYGMAFIDVLSQLGTEISVDPHIRGIGISENWPKLLDKYKVSTDKSIEELSLLTNQSYQNKFEFVELTNGFEQFIKDIKRSDILTALATSNNWVVVDKILEKFDLEQYFVTITTREEISLTKPSPEIYLLTADKLAVEPRDCLVIEDADAGIEAAKLAGMLCVSMKNDNELADLHIRDFTDLSPDKLLKLLTTQLKNQDKIPA